MKTKIIILSVLLLFLFGCDKTNESSKDTKQHEMKLRFDWIPTMSFAGDIVGMNNFALKNDIELKLSAAGEGIDPIKMILAGVDDIGVIGLDKLLMANEKGANLIAIGIVDNITPTVFMSKKEKNIVSPNDFKGNKVGVQSGGATEFVYRSLIRKLGIDESEINEVQIGFDMKSFVQDKYDVRPGFIFDEAVFLEINNIPFNLIEPRDYGLNYPGRVYFVKKEFWGNNKKTIQAFINTVAEGWEFALQNPDSAIALLKKFESKIDYKREHSGLLKADDYFSGYNKQILMPDTNAMNEMITSLIQLGVLTKSLEVADYFDLTFVNEYHKHKNQ